MRFFLFIFIGIVFNSCNEKDVASNEQSVEMTLLNGEWRLVSSEKPFNRFQNGLKFSEDGQVFNIDTQGKVVPPHHERIFRIYGDTLSFVDYKYLEKARYVKGTDILIIKQLTEDKMILEVIHPGETNELIFKNVNE